MLPGSGSVSSPPAALLTPGHTGRRTGAPGLVVRECLGLQMASLVARRGQAARASEAALAAFGVRLPATPRAVTGGGATFLWAGPGQWLAETAVAHEDIEAFLAVTFAGLAAVCDQSDSRVVLDVAGTRVRDVLAKGVPIDLHAGRFRDGDVALTAAGQVGVQLRQTSAAPSYRLSVARSYFGSFWHWLAASAAEFGCEVAEPGLGADTG
jgi:methylglutamate dehydrogenase subunit D